MTDCAVIEAPQALPALPLPEVPTREQIERLEREMLAMEQARPDAIVALPTWHHFADGLAARTICIKAGTLLTGAAHLGDHLNVAHGDITVWTEDGMRRLVGYHVLPSRAGAKRVGLAHADTWWTTVHANPDNCRDERELERRLVEQPHQLQTNRVPQLVQQATESLQ